MAFATVCMECLVDEDVCWCLLRVLHKGTGQAFQAGLSSPAIAPPPSNPLHYCGVAYKDFPAMALDRTFPGQSPKLEWAKLASGKQIWL